MELRLWHLLKQRHVSQAEFARRLGVTVSGLSINKRFSPSVNKLKEYADAIGVPVWELLVDCGEPLPAEDPDTSSKAVCQKCGTVIETDIKLTISKQ